MITTFNEYLEPSFELTKEETEELTETGFVVTDDGFCITMMDNHIQVFKEFEDYEGITLYREK